MMKPRAEFYVKDADGLNKRERAFCLYMLACQGKKPKWAAGMAKYSGDLGKRARSLLEQPVIQAFLAKYSPPVNKFKVTGDKASLLKRLEQIASGEGIDKTVIAQLKAIELRGKAEGLWEGASESGKDRLRELEAVFRAGPVERGSVPCHSCRLHVSAFSKFCNHCGAEMKKDPEIVPVVKGKKAKAEVIQ